MFIYDDDLYFTSTEVINDFNNIGRLFKVNLLSEEIVLDTILEIPDVFRGIYIKDDLFYYTRWLGREVLRLNIDNLNAVPDTIISDLHLNGDIEIAGSNLYVSASLDGNFVPSVLKFDLQALEDSPIIYFEYSHPLRIYINENNLYITSREDNNIQKLDLSDPFAEEATFIDSLFGPTALIAIEDNLYFADDEEEYTVDSRMVKINITDPDRELVPFLDEFEGIHEIVYYAGYLYVSEVLSNKISRFKLPISTGIYPIASQEVSLYPNPTSDILNIEGKVDVKYNSYSFDGKKISNGNTKSDSQIDVSNLPIGSYILFLSDGCVGSFQKL